MKLLHSRCQWSSSIYNLSGNTLAEKQKKTTKQKLILNVLQQKTILAEAATCCYLLLDVVIDRWIVL